MSIETTAEYKADIKARRLFGSLVTSLNGLSAHVEAVLTNVNGIKLTIAQAALSLAEVEALYVEQTHGKRKVDALLHETQAQLTDLIERTRGGLAVAIEHTDKHRTTVDGLLTQAHRIVTEPSIIDTEGPVDNIEYVGIDFFIEQLGASMKSVRRYIDEGKLPAHDTISTPDGAGRPSQLWMKSKAQNGITAYRAAQQAKPQKRGIAALV